MEMALSIFMVLPFHQGSPRHVHVDVRACRRGWIAIRAQSPDTLGRFGTFGGRFVPETLMDALNQLAAAYESTRTDPDFQARLDDYLKNYVGRPSPLFLAERLTKFAGGAEIYLKREDLNHTGAQDQ